MTSIELVCNLRWKILIADPKATLIGAILTSKEGKNYEFATAKTGPDALKKIQEFEPDLLLIDLMMPHIHGIEVIKIIAIILFLLHLPLTSVFGEQEGQPPLLEQNMSVMEGIPRVLRCAMVMIF